MPPDQKSSQKPPPVTIAGAAVILYTAIDDRHEPRGYVRHAPHGGPPVEARALAICRYPEESSVYLFYCDEDWTVLAECWHPRLEEARAQAELEFEGVVSTWTGMPAGDESG